MDDTLKLIQIEKKIENLEQERTLIEFKERLTMEDWDEINAINMEISKLKEELNKIKVRF